MSKYSICLVIGRLVIFIFENEIKSIVGLNIKSGYFFYELFFYATYTSVGVLIPFTTVMGQPLNIILSTINRLQNSKNKIQKNIDANPKMMNTSSNMDDQGIT